MAGRLKLPFCVAMKLPVHETLVPSHIDGFAVETDFRVSRFSAVGLPLGERARAEHSRAELELNLVMHGSAQVLVGKQRLLLEPGHLLWIAPRQNRLVIDASSDFRAWVLVFRPRLVRRVCTTEASAQLRRTGGDEVLRCLLPRAEARALSALFTSLPVGAGRDVFNAGLGYALARAWLAHRNAPQSLQPEPSAAVHPAVRKAAWLMREGRLAEDNPRLAAAVGLSAQRLSRLFKQQMGTSLVEFRNRQRIEHLLAELGDGEPHKLLALALDAGFGSYTQFGRVFRKQLGCTPAEYVRRRRTRAT
jgi:AraC-like DNA-binding protein